MNNNLDIIWVENAKGQTIFIQSFDPETQYDEMLNIYRKYMIMPKVKAFKMPLCELQISVRIDTEL